MAKLGSDAAVIRLVADNTKRILLDKHSNVDCDVDVVVGLNQIKAPKNNTDLYWSNLLWNPFISINEVRIGWLLFELLEMDFNDPVFVVSERFHMNSVGEDGHINFRSMTDVDIQYVVAEKQSLLDKANDKKMNMAPVQLIEILNRLHSFAYITCTEVYTENLDVYRVGFNYKEKELLLSANSKLVHIRINHHFDRIDMMNRWHRLD